MKFDLFEETFHVDDPISLIEAYCYQNDFYQHYDLLLNKSGNRTLCDTNKIGARISKKALKTCEPMLLNLKNIMIFKFTIEIFLFMNDRIRERYIKEMHDKIIIKMMAVEKIGLSRSTKILHTLYPEIIPMIDNLLREEYKKCCERKNSNYYKSDRATNEILNIFNAYYKSLRANWYNLTRIEKRFHKYVPCLTRIRIFDILWWSYLEQKRGQIYFSTFLGLPGPRNSTRLSIFFSGARGSSSGNTHIFCNHTRPSIPADFQGNTENPHP